MMLRKILVIISVSVIGGQILPAYAAAQSSPDPQKALTTVISQVSCPEASFCMAVGNFQPDAQSRRNLVFIRTNNGWTANAALQPDASFDSAQLNLVSCSSSAFCLAIGSYSQKNGASWPWVEEYSNGSWRQLYVTLFGQSVISDVSCTSPSFCMVVGGVFNGVTATHSRVYDFDGLGWKDDRDLQLAQLGMIGKVRCLADASCVVAGSTTSISDPHYALARYNQGAWKTDVGFDREGRGQFQGLSCSSLWDCTVIGRDYLKGGLVVARRTADSWMTIDQSIYNSSLPGHVWRSISCTTSKCFLAGATSLNDQNYAGVHGLIDQAVTNNWQTAQVEPKSAAGSNKLRYPTSGLGALSCVSDNFCLATGTYYIGQQPHLYAASYNGRAWVVEDPFVTMPNPVPVAAAKPATPPPISYVAFGDSITTGFSIAACRDNRLVSPWGCQSKGPLPATPYPDKVAQQLGLIYSDSVQAYRQTLPGLPAGLARVGIWGYTVQEAAVAKRQGHNSQGRWLPQLLAIEKANTLVTGSLGINDLHFSDVAAWVRRYFKPGSDHVADAANDIIRSRAADFDELFRSLSVAKQHGARVVVGLYYNPYDSPNKLCSDLNDIGDRLVSTLDAELTKRALAAGIEVADFRPAFHGHGAGSQQPYVFGRQCSASSAVADWAPRWLGGGGGRQRLAVGFDPHPNNAGTSAMSAVVIKAGKL